MKQAGRRWSLATGAAAAAPARGGAIVPAFAALLVACAPSSKAVESPDAQPQVGAADAAATDGGNPDASLPPGPGLFRPPSGGLVQARRDHEAALLSDGRVLIVGGVDPSTYQPLASAELYRPADEDFVATQAMASARAGHAAVTLLDGRVLVTGGSSDGFTPLASTEIYDPVTDRFAPGPNMAVPRLDHSATLLLDGRVLVAGGESPTGATAQAEVFDPAVGQFAATSGLVVERRGHEAIRLLDGRVLVTGGPDPQSTSGGGRPEAESYDPAGGGFTLTGDLGVARNDHRLARLGDGRVLVTGAFFGQGVVLPDAERFDPGSATFAPVGPMLGGRIQHTMTTLDDGRVLVAGGRCDGGVFEGPTAASDQAELFTPADNGFAAVESRMMSPRAGHSATRLTSGAILLVGGDLAGDAELFIP